MINNFKYEDGTSIQFFKCNNCNDIITGAIHHALEECTCGNYIDQEEGYTRGTGEFTNVTNDLTNMQKREVFTKTVFNCDCIDEDYIKTRLKNSWYNNEIFNLKTYKQLYKTWKQLNNSKLND
jgi:hypothetical protein